MQSLSLLACIVWVQFAAADEIIVDDRGGVRVVSVVEGGGAGPLPAVEPLASPARARAALESHAAAIRAQALSRRRPIYAPWAPPAPAAPDQAKAVAELGLGFGEKARLRNVGGVSTQGYAEYDYGYRYDESLNECRHVFTGQRGYNGPSFIECGDLQGYDLAEYDLSYVSLRGINLAYANLDYVPMHHSDFTGAVFSYASMRYADLSEALFDAAYLYGAHLYRARADKSFLRGAVLYAADLYAFVARAASFNYADLRYAYARGANFTPFSRSYFNGYGADFRGVISSGVVFFTDIREIRGQTRGARRENLISWRKAVFNSHTRKTFSDAYATRTLRMVKDRDPVVQ